MHCNKKIPSRLQQSPSLVQAAKWFEGSLRSCLNLKRACLSLWIQVRLWFLVEKLRIRDSRNNNIRKVIVTGLMTPPIFMQIHKIKLFLKKKHIFCLWRFCSQEGVLNCFWLTNAWKFLPDYTRCWKMVDMHQNSRKKKRESHLECIKLDFYSHS